MPVPEAAPAHRHRGEHTHPDDRLSVELARSTRPEHDRINRVLRMPDRLSDPGRLMQVLQLWVRLWSEVAPASGPGPGPDDELPRLATRSLARLRDDLTELSALAAQGRTAPTEPPPVPERASGELGRLLASEACGWGLEYVLRGSLAGGRVLAPAVTSRLRLPPGVGVRYLSGEGDDIGPAWDAFRQRLDVWGATAPAEDCQAAVDAAVATFRTVQGWAQELLADGTGDRRPGQGWVPAPREGQ